ncbi:MAG: amino acid adenylation domain-containing protein [Candidatus Omnitrophota bacterium]
MSNPYTATSDKLRIAAGQKIKEKEYWLDKLSGNPPQSNFVFPLYSPNAESSTNEVRFTLDNDIYEGLTKLRAGSDIRLHMILTAVLTLLLNKFTGNDDIITGTPIIKTDKDDVDLINKALILRSHLTDEMTFKDLLLQIRQTIIEADEHRNYPVELLLEQLNLTVDTAILLENIHDIDYLSPLKPAIIFSFLRTNTHIQGGVQYHTSSLQRNDANRMVSYFNFLLNIVLSDPDVKIRAIELVLPEEKERLLIEFNHTRSDYPRDKTISQLFEEQVETFPDRIAVIGPKLATIRDLPFQLTYKKLNERADQLADALIEKGIGPDTIVAIKINRSIEMIIGILGILKADGAYLPIETDYPQERIDYMIQDSRAFLLVTTNKEGNCYRFGNRDSVGADPCVCPHDFDEKKLGPHTGAPISAQIGQTHGSAPTNIAYVIYTSGSTGKPKGVLTIHSNVIRVVKNTNYIAITPHDRILQLSNVAFDGSVFDIYGALLNGSTLVLIDKDTLSSVNRLANTIQYEYITVMFITAALFNVLIDFRKECFSYTRKILFGGERVSVEHARKALEFLGKDRLINAYGPTETTVFASYYGINEIGANAPTIPIGKPLSNTRIHILDRYMNLVPPGITGELFIGGEGVARGYLNNVELTNEKICLRRPGTFLKKGSWTSKNFYFDNYERLYKTGDLGRWLDNGNIEFLGRIDHQIKLRGFRIELGEIENHLLKHDSIREAVVILKEDQTRSNRFLCAYVTTNRTLNENELKDYLSGYLPDYMIPSYFIQLQKLPLTSNGKIDIRALPEPNVRIGKEYIAPRNDIERRMANLWEEILHPASSIGIDDDFFQLGGHSLKATLLASRIFHEFGVNMSLSQLFNTPTIRELSLHMTQSNTKQDSIIPQTKKEAYYPLSSAQKRLYILQQLNPDSISYHIPFLSHLEGHLDHTLLEHTFQQLIARHESLRTSFHIINDIPVQRIHDHVDFKLNYFDTITPWSPKVFDLSKAPLMWVGLIREDENKHILIVDMHHIISDGTSAMILINDFMSLVAGKELPPLTIQYKDYSVWQQKPEIKTKQELFWLEMFNTDLPVLNLPYDFPRPPVQSFEGDTVHFEIGEKLTRALHTLALNEKTTLFIVLLTIYNMFLSKITGQEDLIVGTPIAGRRHADIEQVIGMFVNTLALRNEPIAEKTFKEFLRDVHNRTIAAYDHQDFQFEELVEKIGVARDQSRNPLFDVMFTLQNMEKKEIEIPGLTLKPYDYNLKISKFDFTFQGTEDPHHILFSVEYCTQLFKPETIERFIAYFINTITQVVENEDRRMADMDILPEDERNRLLVAFNDSEKDYPADKSIDQLFDEQVEKTPDHLAIIGSTSVGALREAPIKITYKQLSEQSNCLARALREKGVGPDMIVAIQIERSIEMIVGIFGILKAGGAYLPIDPGYPQDRIDYMLKDSCAKFLLATEDTEFTEKLGKIYRLILITQNTSNKEKRSIPLLDNPKHFSSFPSVSSVTSVAKNSNLIYVIYTSGSTGKPKGVMVPLRGFMNLLYWFMDEAQLSSNDNILLISPISFDLSQKNIFAPLINGGRLTLAPPGIPDYHQLSETIGREKITILNCAPEVFYPFIDVNRDSGFVKLRFLRLVMMGGEAIQVDQLLPWAQVEDYHCDIINAYGPTEGTDIASIYRISRQAILQREAILIGKPIPNLKIFILDKNHQPLPVRVSGELYIGGIGVARGYLNRPELTSDKFTSVSPVSSVREKLYKTGDLCRWLDDANVEFLGRIDHQVKIRGYRIELGEIESRLLSHEDVKEAVVVPGDYEAGGKRLFAYIVPKKELNIQSLNQLKEYLSKQLPDYMIPSYFVRLETLPLTPSGKMDRKRLPAPEITPGDASVYTAPRNYIERKLTSLWSGMLNRDDTQIGIDANFFESGGHSLSATILASKIHKTFHIKIPLAEIFKRRTIRLLAQYIAQQTRTVHAAVEPVEKKEYYPLSSAQKRLYFLQQMDPSSTAYNMPSMLHLGADIDKEKIESALTQLIARHESLRTSFIKIDETPVQRVHDHIDFKIDYFELSEQKVFGGGCTPGSPGTFFQKGSWSPKAIHLSQPPLMRSAIIRHADGSHTWFMDIHHIISDGTSHLILTNDFLSLYNDRELEPLRLHYKDFSEWQNRAIETGQMQSQEDYWLRLFPRGQNVPRLNLPTDYPRPPVFTFAGDRYVFELETEQALKFKALALKHAGTLYMNLLTALNVLFYKYTGQNDIIIGSGIAGRRHDDLQGIIGMFVNTLAMRNFPEGHLTYESFFRNVVAHSLEAFENQDLQFEEFVDTLNLERDPSRNPLFDILMVVQNFGESKTRDRISIGKDEHITIEEYETHTAKFDLTFFVDEREDGVGIHIEYYSGIFTRETIQRLVTHLTNVIQSVIETPFIPLDEIEIISEEEKTQIIRDFNNTASDYPRDKTVHELFAEHVEKDPDRMAIVGVAGYSYVGAFRETPLPTDRLVHMSYRELDRQANRIADYLYHQKGIRTGDRVGIWMSPSLLRPAVILGILKAGAAYVPIDPSFPYERIQYMIHDAVIGVLISEKKYLRDLNRLQWDCHCLHTYLCVDSDRIDREEEIEKNALMEQELWVHVGETAVDDVTGGGWLSSYTGEPIPKVEMDEYGDNILTKLQPLLHPGMRVLEVGCASGISMYRIAPRVGLYVGTDLSPAIIEKNRKRLREEGQTNIKNIKLSCLPAHDIDSIDERNFDLVIINSVIQCFHGHNYLKNVLRKCIGMLGENGYLFIGDIMDQEKKNDLIADLTAFKSDPANVDKNFTTKTDWSAELFIARGFFTDLAADWNEIEHVSFSDKIYTPGHENELTKFRYDTLLTINKTSISTNNRFHKQTHQDDIRMLANHEPLSLKLSKLSKSSTTSDDLIYIIYTSGTTGRPKGVLTTHANVTRVVRNTNYIEITPEDRVLQLSNVAFDGSVFDIYGALLNSASLVLTTKEEASDVDRLADLIKREQVTVFFVTTALFNTLADWRIDCLEHVRNVLFGGERASVEHARKALQYMGKGRIINMYGPTETTVFASYYPVNDLADHAAMIPIGKPLSNTSLYILDRYMNLLPVGVQGELFIGGTGVSRGYLNRPEFTADKFFSVSSVSSVREKLYKTGDLCRWLRDGNIEFLGRIDSQVKIRGFRIELGEIESHLMNHHSVKEAVVLDRDDETGSKCLCAFIIGTSGKTPDISELKAYLSVSLPSFMIPATFTILDRIPLTPNGKVDRKALLDSGISGMHQHDPRTYVPPATKLEEKLVDIWKDVLGTHDRVSVADNFFDLGGHSLKATILTSKIHKELNIKVPLAEVFTRQTIRELAQYIERLSVEKYAAIENVEEKEYYALSSAQERVYILQQMNPGGTAYNMSAIIPVDRPDLERFETVFKQLIRRHESLRTSFHMIDETPVQRIHDEVEFRIEVKDKEMDHPETMLRSFIRPFDLARAPLLRVGLVNNGNKNHFLLVDMHHIISDGTSCGVLEHEFKALYLSSSSSLPALRLQYKDYSEWQRRETYAASLALQESYWLETFSGELPVLNLPLDYPRPAIQRFEGSTVDFLLNENHTQILKRIAENTRSTLYMVILAVYTILLSKLSGQDDIVVGTPVAARRHVDLQHIIGMFVNTLAMRNVPSAEQSFREFLNEVKTRTLEAFENQEYPFELLVDHVSIERDLSRNPLFDVMLNVLNQADYRNVMPIHAEQTEHRQSSAKFDLNLTVMDIGERLLFSFEYGSHLFKPSTIDRFIGYFKHLISMLTSDDRSLRSLRSLQSLCLSELDIIPPKEREAIIRFSNGNESIGDGINNDINQSIHQLFEAQVEKTPNRVAVIGSTSVGALREAPLQMTYKQLNEQSDRLAYALIEKGVGPDTIVGIQIERSIEMIIGIFGILKAGGAYLPIDPTYPKDRIDYMLKDSGATLLITDSTFREFSRGAPACAPDSDQIGQTHGSAPTAIAYVIYTSGSTGTPKGVAVPIKGFINLLYWYIHELELGEEDNLLLIAPVSFDLCQKNLFSSFLIGGKLTLAPSGIPNYDDLSETIRKERITLMNCAPGVFYPLVDINEDSDFIKLKSLRWVVLGGEPIQVDKLLPWVNSDNYHCEIVNTYGPTECTDIASFSRMSREALQRREIIPIGKPIPNVKTFILDRYHHIVPVMVSGELFIGGIGVSRGYLNRPELTADKFSSVSSVTSVAKKLYKTGDLCRWLEDGNIEFLGRIDHQIKIRGYRIELGEIESRLLNHESITQAVVMVNEDGTGDKFLCAYIVTSTEIDTQNIRDYLSKNLPDYMIPSYFVKIEKLPLNPSGKVDRNALPHSVMEVKKTGHAYASPTDDIEEKLVDIWSDILGLSSLGIDDNFFELGGHSLKATIMVSKIHKAFDVHVPLTEIFRSRTVRELAKYIRGAVKKHYMSIEPAEEKEYYPLSSAQKRLYVLQQMDPETTAYNMPLMVPCRAIDKNRLENVFKTLIERHESLRTSFHVIDEQPMQTVHDKVDFKLESIDLTLPKVYNPDISEPKPKVFAPLFTKSGPPEAMIRSFIRPFSLSSAPLIRVGLIPTGEASHLLIVDMHHIITDGVSHNVITNDFMNLYEQRELIPLPLQYKDYAEWQNANRETGILDAQEKFWLSEFSGELPAAALPTDYSRPTIQSFEGNIIRFELDDNENRALEALTRSFGTTLFMTLLSVYYIFLSKITGQEDIVVGTPVSGRSHADLEKLIGVFINTLALRNAPSGYKTFGMFLNEVNERTTRAFDNQDYPFEDFVGKIGADRDMSRNPLFDTAFTLQHHSGGEQTQTLEGIFHSSGEHGEDHSDIDSYVNRPSKFDLAFIGSRTPDTLYFTVEYCTKLYKPETVERFAGYFRKVLSAILENPQIEISSIDVVPENEKRQILEQFNNSYVAYPRDKTIHQRIEAQVAANPDRLALVFGELHLSYAMMNERVNRLAWTLRDRGIGPDSIVGLIVERTPEMIIGMLGILKAGGCYLPIDYSYPEKRNAYMLADCSIDILLTQHELEERIAFANDASYDVLYLDDPDLYDDRTHNPDNLNTADDLALILYTSGSTGKPKGAMLIHRGVVNVENFYRKIMDVTENDRVLLFGSLAFDASTFEMYMALFFGASLYILTKDIIFDYRAYEDSLNRWKISALLLPPVYLSNLLPERVNPFRLMVTGGARPTYSLIDKWKNKVQYINAYGPTEITICCTMNKFNDSVERYNTVPIGKPLCNDRLYLLDKYNHLVPVGVAGEVYIAGDGLARGYLNNPELTLEKFLSVSSVFSVAKKLYRTGDLARWLPDGSIEFLGRIDLMVKIRGFRIELGEIESRLQKIEDVKQAVVLAKENDRGDGYLCAYIFSDTDKEFKVQDIREYLAAYLPDYMIPSYFKFMKTEEIPLTPSDKIDIKALPPIDIQSDADYIAPRNEVEDALTEIWSEVLGVEKEKIGMNDSYFDLGGNSIKVIQINNKIKGRFNRDIPVVMMFRYTTIGRLAEYIVQEFSGNQLSGSNGLNETTTGIIEEEKLNEMDESIQETMRLFGDDE